MADFLGTYVEATIDIWGRYVSSEMSDTATKSGSGLPIKFLKFIVTESLAVLAGGVAGKVAGKVMGALSNKVTDFAGGLVSDSMEQDLLAKDLKKRQDTLDKINASLAAGTGKFVTAGVNSLVKSLRDDGVDRTKWVARAPLSPLDLFRIPEEVTPVDRSLIRSVVAGVIAGKAHQHDANKPCSSWGLQCGIAEMVPPGSVGELDDNVIKIGVTPAPPVQQVKYIRFFSASPVLATELAGQAQVSMVPEMALRIEADLGDPSLAAAAVLATAGKATRSDPAEEDRFARRYEQLDKQSGHDASTKKGAALLTRNPAAGFQIAGVGLAEALWLYQLATRDSSLAQLASEISRRHLSEQDNVRSDADGPVSEAPSASRLAELAHAEIEPVLLAGVKALITEHLGTLVLPAVEPKGRRVAR